MGMRLPKELEAKVLALAGVSPFAAGCSEEEFQASVIDEARRQGWEPYHTFNSKRSVPGFPDLVLIRGPVLIVAELKVKKNKPTAAQEKWLALFAGVPGVRVFRWRPENWQDIVKELSFTILEDAS